MYRSGTADIGRYEMAGGWASAWYAMLFKDYCSVELLSISTPMIVLRSSMVDQSPHGIPL
jgi:hypothetical protein